MANDGDIAEERSTMWIGKFVILFAAGLVGANAVPHYVKGITGARHMSPFGKPSSAVVNVAWGASNLLGALWLGVWASHYGVTTGAGGSVVIAGRWCRVWPWPKVGRTIRWPVARCPRLAHPAPDR
jgi:hypothetical protein